MSHTGSVELGGGERRLPRRGRATPIDRMVRTRCLLNRIFVRARCCILARLRMKRLNSFVHILSFSVLPIACETIDGSERLTWAVAQLRQLTLFSTFRLISA